MMGREGLARETKGLSLYQRCMLHVLDVDVDVAETNFKTKSTNINYSKSLSELLQNVWVIDHPLRFNLNLGGNPYSGESFIPHTKWIYILLLG